MSNNQTYTQRCIEINGEQIAVTEEVYRAYKRPLWAEHKRRERDKRCGYEHSDVCAGECRLCDKDRKSRALSLERFHEDGFDIPDKIDMAEFVADKLLAETLETALSALEPDNLRIVKMLFFEDMSEREVAANIGLSQKGVNKRKAKILAQLREHLKNFI
jgi:RNA polymerase sigma factor (sigma-70 family)